MFPQLLPIVLFGILFATLPGCSGDAQAPREDPIKRGVLDVSYIDLLKTPPLALSGEWEFYYNTFVAPEDFLIRSGAGTLAAYPLPVSSLARPEGRLKPAERFVKLPAGWNDLPVKGGKGGENSPDSDETTIGSHGIATYAVHIKGLAVGSDLAFNIHEIGTAYQAYFCPQGNTPRPCRLLTFNGIPGKVENTSVPQILPRTLSFIPETTAGYLVFHVSNFHHRLGGMFLEIRLGNHATLQKNQDYNRALSLISIGIILIMGLYHLGLFSQRTEDLGSLFFGLFCLDLFIRTITVDRIINIFFPEPSLFFFELSYKMDYLSYALAVPLFYQFISWVFKESFSQKVVPILFWSFYGAFGLLTLLTSTNVFSHAILYAHAFTSLAGVYVIYGLVRAVLRKTSGSTLSAIGFFFFFGTFLNDMLFSSFNLYQSVYLANYGFLVFIFAQSMILAVRFSNAYEESEELRVSTSRFVPLQFLKFLDKSSITDVSLGDAVLKNMTVLFTDIREFTTLSESMTPQENFKFLNSYLNRIEPAIHGHGGFVDKFIGDAVMALFSEDPEGAIRAAIEMRKNIEEYNQSRIERNYEPLRIGIGINTGDLMLGTVGTENRLDGTVIGDTVNLASRLETLTKKYKTGLLIAESVYNSINHTEEFKIREIGLIRVKGKHNAVKVFEVYNNDPEELIAKKDQTVDILKSGILLFQSAQFTPAIEKFEECQKINPDDVIPGIYIDRCERYLNAPPSQKVDTHTLS